MRYVGTVSTAVRVAFYLILVGAVAGFVLGLQF